MQNISPSTPLFQRLGQHIQSTIEQVSVRLKYFLDNVHTIYETHGINFQVKHNYTNLMRMITPFQLLSRFHVIDNGELFHPELIGKMMQAMDQEDCGGQRDFQQESAKKSDDEDNNSKFNPKSYEKALSQHKSVAKSNVGSSALQISKKIRQQIRQAEQSKRLKKQRKQQEMKEMKELQNFSHQQKETKDRKQEEAKLNSKDGSYISLVESTKKDKKGGYRKHGIIGKKRQNLSIIKPNSNYFARESIYYDAGRNYLPEELQDELCDWGINQINSGKPLLVRDIYSHANYLGRMIPNLSLSSGWYQRFCNKYPRFTRLFRKSRGYNRENRSQTQTAGLFFEKEDKYKKPYFQLGQHKNNSGIYEEEQFEGNEAQYQMNPDDLESQEQFQESKSSKNIEERVSSEKKKEKLKQKVKSSDKEKAKSPENVEKMSSGNSNK